GYVRASFGSTAVYDLSRTALDALMYSVEKISGRGAAVHVCAEIAAVFRYWEGKDDAFHSPAPRGWTPGKPRERYLSHEEIRDVWLACDHMGGDVFARIVKLLLLTGCRRSEIGRLHSDELKGDDLRGRYIEIAAGRM